MKKTLRIISFCCFALVGFMGFVFAFFYLTRMEFMPYHADAVGLQWQDVNPHIQVLIIALMRVSGGGWLATSIGITFLLIGRIKYKMPYLSLVLVLIGLAAMIPTLIATLYVKHHSSANPPWLAATGGIVLLVIAYILEQIGNETGKDKLASEK